MKGLLSKIKSCKTMPELDELRLELVQAGKSSPESFRELQSTFISQKNKLNRTPLRDRTW